MCQKKGDEMSVAVSSLTERIVRETMIAHGVKKGDARRIVARDAGIAPGALERLAGGRLVHVDRITEKLQAYVIRHIERQIIALQHELEIARIASERPDEADILRAEAALEEAKKALKH